MAFYESFPVLGPGEIEGWDQRSWSARPLPQSIDSAAIMGHRRSSARPASKRAFSARSAVSTRQTEGLLLQVDCELRHRCG